MQLPSRFSTGTGQRRTGCTAEPRQVKPGSSQPRPPRRGGPPPSRDSTGAGQRRKGCDTALRRAHPGPSLGPTGVGAAAIALLGRYQAEERRAQRRSPPGETLLRLGGRARSVWDQLPLCYSAGALVSSRVESTTPLTAGPGPARPGSGRGPLFMGAIALPGCCRAAEGGFGGGGGSDRVGRHSPPGQALIVAPGPPWVACAPHVWMQQPSRYPTGA